MATEISIDTALIQEAISVGEASNPAEVVQLALREYIAQHKREKIFELFGKVDYEPDYDYKAQRQRS